MKAAAMERFGPPAVLRLHTLPVPAPGPREVRIALHAAGVGVWDADVRDGSWRPFGRPSFPLIPGTDGAGIVAARGARVRRLRVGDRVWAADYEGGFYAEYVAVDVDRAAPVPRRLDLLHAGAAVVTGLTALQGIDDALRLRRGETVLIFGASGAVGTLAVQFARRRGARVLATASGRDATRLVRRLGAHGVIDARKAGVRQRLRTLVPDGLDAALALAGGAALETCLDLVRAGGRVAYPNGVEPEPRRRPRVRSLAYDAELGPREFARLGRAVTEARLEVPIAAVYPLAVAARAHARLERGHILGRIVLRIRRAGR
jgi:NADPH:quinone reductase-like Zn-dependent oxidoreductase